MSINSINPVGPAVPVQKAISAALGKQDSTPSTQPAADRVELSGTNPGLQTSSASDIRAAKVATIKAQIAAGTYEDGSKLDAATNKLLDVLLQ
jgi:flagellar biosynthesis anti-sigma factor FlgM